MLICQARTSTAKVYYEYELIMQEQLETIAQAFVDDFKTIDMPDDFIAFVSEILIYSSSAFIYGISLGEPKCNEQELCEKFVNYLKACVCIAEELYSDGLPD